VVNRSRRRFLWRGLGSTAALAAGAGLYAWRIEPHRVESSMVRFDARPEGTVFTLHGG
jgi:hypothetical protein